MNRYRYTLILLLGVAIYIVADFIVSVVENGFPVHPAYFISSAIMAFMGFIAYRMFRGNDSRDRRIKVSILGLVCFIIPIVFYYSGIEVLKATSGSQLWLLLVFIGFYFWNELKRSRKQKQVQETLDDVESYSKGIVLFVTVMLVLFLPIIILVAILVLL